MSHATHPCPPASPAPGPLRVTVDEATGELRLSRAEAIRLALALAHLASFAHWSPHARGSDRAMAEEAAWMAEILGDHARTAPPSPG